MCSKQFCLQTPFMKFGGQPQASNLMSQFSESSGLERSEPKDRSHDWGTGNIDRDFDVRGRSENSWHRSSYEDKRQSSPIPDQRNTNFGRDKNTVTARNDRSVRDYSWEQTNMPAPRDGTVRREDRSRWASSNLSTPRDECNINSKWNEPNPTISRYNRSRNEPVWELTNTANDRDQAYTRSLRTTSRPSMGLLNRNNDRPDLTCKDDLYNGRKAVQGNWGAGYGQQNPTHCPEPFNSKVFGVSGQSSSMFGSHVTESAQESSGSQKGRGPRRWDNSNRASDPQGIFQQRQLLSEKNRPERVSRPSPRHEERYISRPSKPGDVRPDRALNKRPQSFRSDQGPPAKKLASQPYARPNLPNTTRRTSPSHPPLWEPPKHEQSGPHPKRNMTKLLRKDYTWRFQAAAAITRQMMKSVHRKGSMFSKGEIIKSLKGCIKPRIDVMLDENLAIPKTEILKMYRQKFPTKTDQAFYTAVLDSMKNSQQYQAIANKPGNDTLFLMI